MTMAHPNIWYTQDSIEYVSIQDNHLNETVSIMRDSFYVDELVAVAVEMRDNVKSRAELDELTRKVVYDGVSIVAIDKSTNKIVGVAVNKLHTRDCDFVTYLELLRDSCVEASSKALLQFMIDADEACNLFELCQVDCILEIVFLTVLPEYRGCKIGRKLFELSIKLAKTLKCNVDMMLPLRDPTWKRDEEETSQLPPGIVSAIFTSPITQKYGRDYDFTICKTINYDKFTYQGKTYAELLAQHGHDEVSSVTIEYLKI